jgi:hypothetical protein
MWSAVLAASVTVAAVALAAPVMAQTGNPCKTTRTGDYYRTDCQAQAPKSHSTFEQYGFIDPKPTNDPSVQLKPYGSWYGGFGGPRPGPSK